MLFFVSILFREMIINYIMDYTEHDKKRLCQLLEKNLEWKELQDKLEELFEKNNDDFTYLVGSDWEKRQLAHIIASKNGWYSKKIMNDYDYGCRSGKCSKCYWLVEIPEHQLNDPWFSPCCDFCDGVCPNGCAEKDEDVYTKSTGKAWMGEILFSKNPLKLGRKARRSRNRWKRGEKL